MHRTRFSVQVAIIGASIAGAACAIELAKKGIPVLILDRYIFPRRKACGEGLSHLATGYLKRLGISADLLDRSGATLYGYHFASPRPSSVNCLIESPKIRGWGISRSVLDAALVARLQELPAATVVTEEPVRALVRNQHSWELVTQLSRITAPFVVVASGANPQAICQSFIKETHRPSSRVGLTSYGVLRKPAILRAVTLIPFPDGEIYITPLGGQAINVSVVGDPYFLQRCRNPRRLEATITNCTRCEVTLEDSSFGAGHFGARHESLDSFLYLVGDTYESFDPLCGLGMTHALASGISAAEAISAVVRDQKTPTNAKKSYEQAHEQVASRIRRSSGAIRGFITAYERFPRATTLAHRIFGAHGLTVLDRLGPRSLGVAV
jgi:flavin-dependent dehydrogenase